MHKRFLVILLCVFAPISHGLYQYDAPKLVDIRQSLVADLESELKKNKLSLGSSLFIRIFKQSRELEVWIKNERYELFKSYPICYHSGTLGPKQEEGDMQSPEGFYDITAERLNPWSQYHLAMNIGYPNAYDKALNRTGEHLMIHGGCVSEGCFAMTNERVEEIYFLVEAALENGQKKVPVHIFPFRMTDVTLLMQAENPWYDFWKSLQLGYEYFEDHGTPPDVSVGPQGYQFG